jgi:hypothetical protein
MPVTGALNTDKFTKGPGLLYLQCGVPTADSSLALTGGVPANGHLVGYTTEGNEIAWGRENSAVNADEASAAVEEVISSETLSIAGTAYSLEDIELLQALLGTGTYQSVVGPPAYDLLQFGGLTQLTDLGLIDGAILVWHMKNSTTKYARFQLYSCTNTANATTRITRQAYGTMGYTLTARPVGTREMGDQLGQLALDKGP